MASSAAASRARSSRFLPSKRLAALWIASAACLRLWCSATARSALVEPKYPSFVRWSRKLSLGVGAGEVAAAMEAARPRSFSPAAATRRDSCAWASPTFFCRALRA